jgi:hypothetical protein
MYAITLLGLTLDLQHAHCDLEDGVASHLLVQDLQCNMPQQGICAASSASLVQIAQDQGPSSSPAVTSGTFSRLWRLVPAVDSDGAIWLTGY